MLAAGLAGQNDLQKAKRILGSEKVRVRVRPHLQRVVEAARVDIVVLDVVGWLEDLRLRSGFELGLG